MYVLLSKNKGPRDWGVASPLRWKPEVARPAIPVLRSCGTRALKIGVLQLLLRWTRTDRLWLKGKNKRLAAGKSVDKPNIIMSSAVQVCWEKAARYFEVQEKLVYCTDERYVIDPEETVNLVDENTIGICVIMGTTYTGEYEDVKGVNDLLIKRGLDVPIHVDAASGGFVAPFVVPELEWDFRLEKVVSINVSGHKVGLSSSHMTRTWSLPLTLHEQYGLVYPGVGWVVWRAAEYLPQELVFNINYLGADQVSWASFVALTRSFASQR